MSIENKPGIYKINSPTGRVYIGQSVDVKNRHKSYKRSSHVKRQRALYNSFEKYGEEAHTFEVLVYCDPNDLNALETFYVSLYEANITGLNLTSGGDSDYKVSDETKILVSEAAKKRWSKLTPEQRSELSWIKGKKMPPEYGRRISELKRASGCVSMGKNPRAKMVLDVSTGIYYDCLKEACLAKNINYSAARHQMQGRATNRTSLVYV
jgi:group I intron endonuclease